MVTLSSTDPVSAEFRDAVGGAISTFLDGRRARLSAIAPQLATMSDLASVFTAGGKRLRPAFCAWGYAAALDTLGVPAGVITAAASLDVLHVSALVHDDVMDASELRRGIPAAHRQCAALHRDSGGRGDSDSFGAAGAILLGNLLAAWSAEMFDTAGLPEPSQLAAQRWLHAVRAEVNAGQYLDVLAQAVAPYERTRTPSDVAELEALVANVVTYKSASYTIARPLNIGGALAGASPAWHDVFAAYGRPLGRAFQYRDDVLGVFGDASLTGKESGEDLREGKLTLLVVKTLALASDVAARRFSELFGDPALDGAKLDSARDIIVESGALAYVEQAIDQEFETAVRALDAAPASPSTLSGLQRLAEVAVKRAF